MGKLFIQASIYLLLWCAVINAYAAIDVHEFANDTERQRYQQFIDELRCPKCQNQNLSGSDSPIANDLRRELYVMIQEGRSDQEIIDFMVQRYGDFILYRPRLTPATLMLWVLPGALLLLGGIILALIVRKRRLMDARPDTGLSGVEQQRLDAILKLAPLDPASESIAKVRTQGSDK